MCEHRHVHHRIYVNVGDQFLRASTLPSLVQSGIELGFSGLYSKCLYPLSQLASPLPAYLESFLCY